MSRIRARDTGPELTLRHRLWARGFRYRLQRPIDGIKPDLVFTKQKVAIFVDGCFWHGCPQHYVRPRARAQFWEAKLRENVERDRRQTIQLESAGWTILRYWEHDLHTDPDRIADEIAEVLVHGPQKTSLTDWRVVRVEDVDAAGSWERRYLEALRDQTVTRSLKRVRSTKKW